ncbi:MAG: LptF/LptG family permease, partial [Alphaproteobacteria bacterium]|nr:LptF/LptG family permease [Alphaproteobacteria bacterium]
MPFGILGFYILRHFLFWLLITATTFAIFALIGDMVETGRIASKLGNWSASLVFSLLRMPSTFMKMMPFVILIATMICLLRLSERRELVTMRMGGLAAWQFLLPIVLCVGVLGVVQITILDPLAATGLRQYQENYTTQIARPEFSFSESGVWLHESDGEGSRILRAKYINTFDDQAVLSDVIFRLLDRQDNYLYRIEARTARLQGKQWQLTKARIIRPGAQAVHHELWQLPTNLDVDDLNHYYRPSTNLVLWQLPAYIDTAKAKGADTTEHIVRLHQLVATPITLIAMVLLA